MRVTYHRPPHLKVVFVLNTSKIRIHKVSLFWQVFFYEIVKSRKKIETSRKADLSFLTALKQPYKLQNRKRKHGHNPTSLQES